MSTLMKLSFAFMFAMGMTKASTIWILDGNSFGSFLCWCAGLVCGVLAIYEFVRRVCSRSEKDRLFPFNRKKDKITSTWIIAVTLFIAVVFGLL